MEKTEEQITNTKELEESLKEAVSIYNRVSRIYISPQIPLDKLKNASEKCEVPENEKIHALVDLTTFGSAKDAILICNKGIYCHWISPNFISYEELKDLEITKSMGAIQIGAISLYPHKNIESILPMLCRVKTSLLPPEERNTAREMWDKKNARGNWFLFMGSACLSGLIATPFISTYSDALYEIMFECMIVFGFSAVVFFMIGFIRKI